MAEQHLVDKAADFTPPALRALGERILEVICPEQYDDAERRALLAAEQRACAATRLTLHVRGDGSVDVRARIPEASAARLQTYLEAFSAPRRNPAQQASQARGAGPRWATPGAVDIDDIDGRRVPADQSRGQAFCAFLEAFDPDRSPLHGGTATTVVVTIDYDALATGSGVGTLGDGTGSAPGRPAGSPAPPASSPPCSAGTPKCSTSAARDESSPRPSARPSRSPNAPAAPTAARCPRPGARPTTPTPWCRGGRTDLADGMLLCSWHHHRIHDDRYRTQNTPDGGVSFHRRT